MKVEAATTLGELLQRLHPGSSGRTRKQMLEQGRVRVNGAPERVAKRAPDAWFVNFTNPAGLVTEAIRDELGDRVVGICDSPAGLCRRVAATLERDPDDLWFDYFGLNHLGWLRSVRHGTHDLLPELLGDDERLAAFEEGRLFGGEWLRALRAVGYEIPAPRHSSASGTTQRSILQIHAKVPQIAQAKRPHAA